MEQTTSQIAKESNMYPSELEGEQLAKLERKMEIVTDDASKPYFRNALKRHAEIYAENAKGIRKISIS